LVIFIVFMPVYVFPDIRIKQIESMFYPRESRHKAMGYRVKKHLYIVKEKAVAVSLGSKLLIKQALTFES